MRNLCVGAALLLAIAGCARGETDADTTGEGARASGSASTSDERARNAALVANAIAANPARADSILTAAGHTRDSFQALIYEIAADSAMSSAYAAVKTR